MFNCNIWLVKVRYASEKNVELNLGDGSMFERYVKFLLLGRYVEWQRQYGIGLLLLE